MSENKGLCVCLLNDSFPPAIDGVANVVVNYADVIQRELGSSLVLTPMWPGSDDTGLRYPVLRYPSIDTRKMIGYVTGLPMNAKVLSQLKEYPVDILHVHCPTVSLLLARELREILHVPIVFTYHTKYDIDIRRGISSKTLQENLIRAMVENISACDEVWVVSEGAGENLRSLGYKGEYTVMNNGVDIPKGDVPQEWIEEAVKDMELPEGVPVFLFVGRMLWYKGQRIILEALEGLHSQNIDFRMVFIGGGDDLEAMKELSRNLGLENKVFFTGPVHNRDLIRAWYTRSDLFLFPSTFDTNGLVVREAAACGTASVLVRNSCAAEGVSDGENAFLISETPASLAVKLADLCTHPEKMKKAGIRAQEELYISWDDAVRNGYDHYQAVIDRYHSTENRTKRDLSDELLKSLGEFTQFKADVYQDLGELQEFVSDLRKDIRDTIEKLYM